MATIKSLQNHLRGWFPQDPVRSSKNTLLINGKTSRHNLIVVYVGVFGAAFTAVLITLGILDVLSLGSYASYAAGTVAAAFAGAVGNLLLKRLNRTRT